MQKEINAEVKGEKIHKDATIEWGALGPQGEEVDGGDDPYDDKDDDKDDSTDEEFISDIEHDNKLNKIFEMMGEGKNGKRNESIE